MINIPLVYDENYSCMENCYYMLLNYLDKNIIFEFAESWGFSYEKSDSKALGEQIDSARGEAFYFLSKYQGIVLSIEDDKANSIITINSNLAVNKPVILDLDVYNCPWSNLYKKAHLQHFCVIIGYDKKVNQFICADSLFTKKYEPLSFNDFDNGFIKIITYEVNESIVHYNDGKDILKESLDYVGRLKNEQGDMFSQLAQFSKDILNIDIDEEIGIFDFDITYAQLALRISRCRLSRINYLEFLKKILSTDELKEFEEAISNFEKIIYDWNLVCNLLYRVLVSRNYNKLKNISDKLLKISLLEKENYLLMKRKLKKNETS